MKRTFHDFLTVLTSTEKLLTQAGFKLAPLGTPVESTVFTVDISSVRKIMKFPVPVSLRIILE